MNAMKKCGDWNEIFLVFTNTSTCEYVEEIIYDNEKATDV